MIAVVGMSVAMHPARPVIDNMGHHDKDHGHGQEPKLVLMPDLLEQQKNNAGQENKKWHQAMMMFAVTVPYGKGANGKGQEDHKVFKYQVINYVDPEYGQTGQQ
jgi:hypothetical protein